MSGPDFALVRQSLKAALAQPAPQLADALDLHDLAQRKAPALEWNAEHWLLRSGPTLIAGGGGIGKSLLEQQMATALAMGRPFIGSIERPVRVLVWNCEDDADELWRRQERISEFFDIALNAPQGMLLLVPRVGRDNVLMGQVLRSGSLARTPAFTQLQEQVNDLQVESLWLDNTAHVFGGNRDDGHQVTTFINACQGMVVGRPFSTVFLTHTSRQAGSEYVGSAAWENACRMRWYLGHQLPDHRADDETPPPSDVRYLAKRKANYTARDQVRLTFRNGVFVPDEAPSHVGGLVMQLDERRAEDIVLAGFKSLQAIGISATDGKNSPDYLPRLLVDKGFAAGYGRGDLQRAMNRLMGAGRLVRGVVGQYANRNPKKGLVHIDEVGLTCTK